jgi:RNA polymerase sigma factor (sigma-70 family)
MADTHLAPVLRLLYQVAGPPGTGDESDAHLLERYARGQDAHAFEALLRRHGPLVWRVCRRVLGHEQHAEDAFQAAFLALARRAASIRNPGALASWLHGVAYRIACKARADLERTRTRQREAPALPVPDPGREAAWRELGRILEEEVHGLPEELRAPLLLCYWEGRTNEEAARQLGWPCGTVKTRLVRARGLLQRRLVRRGVSLPAGVAAALLAPPGARALMPATGVAALRAALALGAGAGEAPARVATLAEAGVRSLAAAKGKAGLALTLAAGVLLAGTGLLAHQVFATRQPAGEQGGGVGRAAQRGDPPRAGAAGPTGTDRFGDPLPAGALARLGTVRFRHGNRIRSLAFTPDGRQLVSHGADGIRIWDAATGREVRSVVPEANGWISDALLTRDGKSVVSMEGLPNRFVARVRDRFDLRLLREFALGQPFLQFRVSPDGKLLAVLGNSDTTIELWDVASGQQLRSWKGHTGRIWGHQFSPDGKALVTCGEDKAIRFWEMPAGKQVRAITGYPDIVGALAFSPDGTLLATVGMTEVRPGVGSWPRDNRVRLWDVKAGREVRRLAMPEKKTAFGYRLGFYDIAFGPDGRTLATSGADDMVRFWDPATGKELRRFAFPAFTLAFAPDGATLAGADGETIRVIDVAGGKDAHPPGGHREKVSFTAVTPDGRVAATAAARGGVRLWDTTTGRPRGRLEGPEGFVRPLRVLGDGRTLLSAGTDQVVRLWDLTTARERQRFQVPFPPRGLFDVSPDGKVVARMVGADGKAVALMDLATGKELHKLAGHGQRPCGTAFSPDGRTLVVWCIDRTAHVWDVAGGHEVRRFGLDQTADPRPVGVGTFGPYAAALSPDGRLLAYGSPDNQYRYLAVQDLATGKVVRVLDRLPDRASALAFSADGRMLAWGGTHDGTVHLVDVATGGERHSFRGHKGEVLSLTFSAGGRLLISGSEDTSALVWDLGGRPGAAQAWGQPLTAKELGAAWADLAGADAARAYRALLRLASAPNEAVPYLRRRVLAVAVVGEEHLARLIAALDSDEFAVRERAAGELEKLGSAAEPACRKALGGQPSAELRRRLEELLGREMRERWSPSPDRLRQVRALEALELADGAEAGRLVEELAKGMPGAWLTEEAKAALERRALRPVRTGTSR